MNGRQGNEFPPGEPGGGFGDPAGGSGGSDWFTPRRAADPQGSQGTPRMPGASGAQRTPNPQDPRGTQNPQASQGRPRPQRPGPPPQGQGQGQPQGPGQGQPRQRDGQGGAGRREPLGSPVAPEWTAPTRPGGFAGASDAGGAPPWAQEGSRDYTEYRERDESPFAPLRDSERGRTESGPYEPYDSGSSGGSGFFGSGRGGGEGGGGGGGEWTNAPRPRRKRRRAVLLPIAGAATLAVLVGVGVYTFTSGGSDCSGSGAVALSVAVAPEVAPAINATVQDFNSQKQTVSGHCVHAVVKSADPAAVTTLLSGQGVSEGQTQRPDVWIPDSSLWANLVLTSAKGKNTVRPTGTSVAETPIIVAMPKSLVVKLSKTGMLATPSWDNLLTAAGGTQGGAETKNQLLPANLVHVSFPDPVHNAAGMSALMLTNELLASDPNKDTIFTGLIRTMQNSTTPTVPAQFENFKANARGQYPVAVTTEQAVWQHNQGKTKTPAIAVYPSEGSTMLNYPVEVTTSDSTKAQAAALLAKAMSSANTQNRIKQLGFRGATGEAPTSYGAATGVAAARPRELPEPDTTTTASVMQAWAKLSLSIRMLTVFDVSNTMRTAVAGSSMTRLEALAKVAQDGLALLPDDTDLGLWEFSSHMDGDKPFKALMPQGPLGQRIGSETRRDLVQNGLAGLKVNTGSSTALYETLIAAYKYMKKNYEPDKINSLLFFTNGTDHLPGGLSIKETVGQLKKLYDPNEPVQVNIIGFGDNADRNELEQLTSTVEGGAYIAKTPEQVAKILLQALSKRICDPNCTKS